MAINGIGGSGFNPYANSIANGIANTGAPQRTTNTTGTTAPTQSSTSSTTASTKSLAEAIKSDANARAEQVNSAKAPEGVDQELWSVLSKEERSFFVKAGAMGPLTYGRNAQASPNVAAPIMRGGRLDIKA